MLVPVLANSGQRAPQGAAGYLFIAVALGMLACMLGILYRNLVFRDSLIVVRSEGMPGQRFDCFVHEILAVRRLPAPAPSSPEGKWAALGLGEGLIEIRTETGSLRFGAGLHEHAIDAAIERITAFCQLQWGLQA
ncbi:hypothetical protein ASF77_17135 [Massilia sp. Leaf139]|nr:hypothetical protein ASF77_17135 [Massilia sp. Leaf139]